MSTPTPRAAAPALNPDASSKLHPPPPAATPTEKAIRRPAKGAIECFKGQLKGEVVLPTAPTYDEVRQVWNAMIQRRPALLVRCAEANDVPAALAFARAQGLELSIRGGGHNIAGTALCDGGLTLDLSPMRRVRVDAKQRRAYVEAGATLAEVDGATQAHGLATPLGINSTTGVAGLTLGGGFGWLTRRYGLTIDNLVAVEAVTAEGRRLRASETENADLFWALRGGGGNFAVVTQFEFRLHRVGPEVLAGLIVFPFEQARQVLKQYREFVAAAPEALNVWAILRQAPPLPFLPADVHGRTVVVLVPFYLGDAAQGMKRIAPLREFGTPHGEHLGVQPYAQWQQAFDGLLTPGARNYWKSHNFTALSDGALDTIAAYADRLPLPQCELFLASLAGAANRVPAEATAYRHRETQFVLNVHGRWAEPADDERCIAWARAFYQAATPYASAGAYVNFMTEEESGRVAAAYGANYERLTRIKAQYDPDNLFHRNQNIPPAPRRG